MASPDSLSSFDQLQAVKEKQEEIDALEEEVLTLRDKLQEALELPVMETTKKLQDSIKEKGKLLERIAHEREEKIKIERKRLTEEYKDREEERNKRAIEHAHLVLGNMGDMPQLIELVVGGTSFSTSRANLFKERESVLAKTVVEMYKNEETRNKIKIKIDRDPKHFSKILNYLRDGERSLVWLEDCSVVDMKETRLEANYYHLHVLERYITWKIVSLKPLITERELPSVCLIMPVKQSDGTLVAQRTQREGQFHEMNFLGCKFTRVVFEHTQSFISCCFSGATFKQCIFNVVIDLSGSKLEGIKFVKCHSDVLPPKEIFVVDEDSQKYIPERWDQ